MRMVRVLAAIATAALGASLVTPAAATPAGHEFVSFRGTMATAVWSSGAEEVPVGQPRIVYVLGATDGTVVRSHVSGSQPERQGQVSVVAMALMLPAAQPGGDPVPAEVWCDAPPSSFTIDRALTSAALAYDCDALVITGEQDEPSGDTIPLTVRATWTGSGSLLKEKSVTMGSDELGWWVDRTHSTVRQAVAHVTVTGPTGPLFDGEIVGGEDKAAEMATASSGHVFHVSG